MKFIIIGITDNPSPWFQPEVLEIIRQGKVFSGGKRHHEIVASLLPAGAQWINITVPLEKVFEQYVDSMVESIHSPLLGRKATGRRALLGNGVGGEALIVFASGDPLFFGFANTIKRKMPEAEIVVYPAFNSLQMLAHRLVMPYHDMRIVSLTGRPWQEFDKALIERTAKIGILTDREHTPAAIARRMMDYGYTYYKMYVGEHLGNPTLEKVSTLALEEAAKHDFSHPNCVILSVGEDMKPPAYEKDIPNPHQQMAKPFGTPDAAFALLDGREKMITKMPIRLLTLQALDLSQRHVFWDIGSCTGSVSIEARLLFPHLHIEAFEIRPECEAIIHENARRFGVPGINVHIGDFLSTPLPIGDGSGVRLPDAVFIGGHGGRLKEIMARVLPVLADDGIIVMNSVIAPKVTVDSHRLWDEACTELGLQQETPTRIQLNEHNPITILKCKRK